MKLKDLKQQKWFSIAGNIYIIVLTVFVVWMLFFDANSLLTHLELRKEIKKLEKQKEYLQEEISKDKEVIKLLKNEAELEKYAREKYYLKKEDEEIYLIDRQDSIKNKKEDE